jgi:hypothetical protein
MPSGKPSACVFSGRTPGQVSLFWQDRHGKCVFFGRAAESGASFLAGRCPLPVELSTGYKQLSQQIENRQNADNYSVFWN